MRNRLSAVNQKIIKLLCFAALTIGTNAAVEQPSATNGTEVQRNQRCPLHFDSQRLVSYPHETDCNRYYLCAENGTLAAMQCPNELEFDADFSVRSMKHTFHPQSLSATAAAIRFNLI